MRVLYHHRTLGDGAEGIHIQSMVDALGALGHDVRVVSLVGRQTNVTTRRTRLLGTLTRALPRTAYEAMELGYSLVGYHWLSGELKRLQPDVLYERYTLFNLAGLAAARRAKVPFVLEVNAPLAHERAEYERLSLKRLARRCERYVCASADLVIVVSTPLKEYLVERGTPPDRVIVLPNGADSEVFRPDPAARARIRARFGIGPEEMVVGFSGILRPWHGLDLLLGAAGRLAAAGRPPTLLIVGDGPSRPDVERMARELRVDRTIITGRVPHSAIPEYLAAFDVGVSPRATFYASPMKIPEYMAVGMAVVAPRMTNIADLITDGVDGLLFTPEDPDSLAAVLASLQAHPERRTRLGSAALQSIAGGRTWRHNAAVVARHAGRLGVSPSARAAAGMRAI